MRILYISNTYYPNFSYRENILPKLLSYKNEVILLSSKYNFIDMGKNFELCNIKENQRLNIMRINSLRIYKNKFIFLKLKMYIKRFSPDIVLFTGGVFNLNGLILSFYKKKYKYKLFTEDHSHFSIYKDNIFERIVRKIFISTSINYLSKRNEAFIAYSQETKAYLISKLNIDENRVKIIPIGIDINTFYPDEDKRKKTRLKLGILENELIIVYAGKIDEEKNPLTLVKAYERITEENAKLLLIGTKNLLYYKKLKSYISEKKIKNIIILDSVENWKLSDYYNASDIGVWPHQESLTMLEAMACGLPVIAKNTKFVIERIRDCGLVYEEGNISDLVEKIHFLINNEEFRSNIMTKSIHEIRKKYENEEILKKYENLFRKYCNNVRL